MYRCCGFILGVIISIGVPIGAVTTKKLDIQTGKFLFAAGILNILTIILFAIFRSLAKSYQGFQTVYNSTLKQCVDSSTQCISGKTQLQVNDSGTITKSTTNNTCCWGMVEMLVFIIVGVLFFILMFYLLIAYPAAIVRQCSKSSSQKENIKVTNVDSNSIANLYGPSSLKIPSYDGTTNIQQLNQSAFMVSQQPNQQPAIYLQQNQN